MLPVFQPGPGPRYPPKPGPAPRSFRGPGPSQQNRSLAPLPGEPITGPVEVPREIEAIVEPPRIADLPPLERSKGSNRFMSFSRKAVISAALEAERQAEEEAIDKMELHYPVLAELVTNIPVRRAPLALLTLPSHTGKNKQNTQEAKKHKCPHERERKRNKELIHALPTDGRPIHPPQHLRLRSQHLQTPAVQRHSRDPALCAHNARTHLRSQLRANDQHTPRPLLSRRQRRVLCDPGAVSGRDAGGGAAPGHD
ncbi:hypothetical protein V492_07760 [Pseudogymnoascus sp. VKM F-4246]|nr:hypothetical protein V492_07760 [Pseudogymnoascus sp. VKM F-4246]